MHLKYFQQSGAREKIFYKAMQKYNWEDIMDREHMIIQTVLPDF